MLIAETVNGAADELPASSDAWQFTVVVPSGKVLPNAGVHAVFGTAVTASEAVTRKDAPLPANLRIEKAVPTAD